MEKYVEKYVEKPVEKAQVYIEFSKGVLVDARAVAGLLQKLEMGYVFATTNASTFISGVTDEENAIEIVRACSSLGMCKWKIEH